ncbi:PAAR domain-containing protein [Burkholderia cepacia]|uniref:PAAR domain-containing protein n=2 Tax=Burkholderia cepacia TaxID=292 RepID=UPI00264D0BD3|nr:PAAR domain-containing protein [Burkholderia cepacia]MDN7909293.1 PAAR domain-containing protein [Burkholderia cepacia]
MKAIVRKGDLTDHGGVVLAGFSGADFSGGPAAGPGHMVSCPKWGGIYACCAARLAALVSSASRNEYSSMII